MKSIKCPQCGFVYWASDPNCKRCGLATVDDSSAAVSPQPQHFQTPNVPPLTMPVYNEAAKLLKYIKTDAIFFYVIGGLQILLWFVIGRALIVDGILNIGLSFVVHKFRSRVAAILLLGVTLLSVAAMLMEIAEGGRTGVFFPVGLILRLLAAGRMVHATFKLNGYVEEGPAMPLPPPPPNFHPDATPQWSEPRGATQWQQT